MAGAAWEEAGWWERATAWVRRELGRQGIAVSGEIEQPHVRPWSTVLRVPTSVGDVYFKAAAPVTMHEPALLEALTRWRPDCIPEVLSVDAEQGWMLLRDAGQRLREIVRSTKEMHHWFPALSLYAEVQMELSARVPEVLALGVPDRRLERLPVLYERLLQDADVLRVDLPKGLSREEYGRLRDLTPRVGELAAQLAGYGIPESLNHGDFHDGNLFVRQGSAGQSGPVAREGGFVFADWGDSCVSHPFYSLRTVLVSAEISLDLEENAPELQPLRDAYLEPWTRYQPRETLVEALRVSTMLASIDGALKWRSLVGSLRPEQREAYAAPVPSLLREFLSAVSPASAVD